MTMQDFHGDNAWYQNVPKGRDIVNMEMLSAQQEYPPVFHCPNEENGMYEHIILWCILSDDHQHFVMLRI